MKRFKKIRLFNIKWETDGANVKLPKSVTVKVALSFDVSACGADLLSDKHGFLVESFRYREVTK